MRFDTIKDLRYPVNGRPISRRKRKPREKIVRTAGRDLPGTPAPAFAHLNGVLSGELRQAAIPVRTVFDLHQTQPFLRVDP